MYVVCVSVWVKTEHVKDFIAATIENGRATRAGEPGNIRFDMSQGVDDPARFFLYEVYDSDAAFRAHQTTEHYLKWRQTVIDWMAQPRQGIKFNSLFPESIRDWRPPAKDK
jgi:(4S)-4-hydroxy-5-phosphonooxypentane-2,3-dione isomerase